jgi:hypothetical protein
MINESGDGVLIGSTVRLEDNLIKNVIGERTSAVQAIAGKSSRSGSFVIAPHPPLPNID